MTTTNEVMRLADDFAVSAVDAPTTTVMDNRRALLAAVDTLVAERDALLTERDTLRQVIEQQLLNVPVGEWKK